MVQILRSFGLSYCLARHKKIQVDVVTLFASMDVVIQTASNRCGSTDGIRCSRNEKLCKVSAFVIFEVRSLRNSHPTRGKSSKMCP